MRCRPIPTKLFDEAGGLLAVGGPQVEGEVAVGRLPLGLGAGEGEEQVDSLGLELLEHRQHAGHGGRAHVAEEQEDLVLQHELHGVLDAGVRLITVVVELEDDFASVDAAVLVNVVEVRLGAAVELGAQSARGTGEGGGHAQDDRPVGPDAPYRGQCLGAPGTEPRRRQHRRQPGPDECSAGQTGVTGPRGHAVFYRQGSACPRATSLSKKYGVMGTAVRVEDDFFAG